MACEPTRPKPLFGDPCNGCGLCCIASQCPLSERIFGRVPRCPALLPDGLGGFGCALLVQVERGSAWREAAALMIGAGTGCDCARGEADEAQREKVLPDMIEKSRAGILGLSPAAHAILVKIRGF